jgi:hypothetical protein
MAEPKARTKGHPITPVAAGGGAGAGNRDHGRRGVGMEWRGPHPARYVLNDLRGHGPDTAAPPTSCSRR